VLTHGLPASCGDFPSRNTYHPRPKKDTLGEIGQDLGEICWEKTAFVQEQAEKLIFVR